jgi:transposase
MNLQRVSSSLSSPFSAHVCKLKVAVNPEEEGSSEFGEVSLGKKRKRKKDLKPQSSKRTPFKRKAPMKGRPVSYKIRMLPTKEQEIELKRCSLACDIAYNFANKRVRDDKMPANTISLRKDWVRADKKLKDKTAGVSSRIMNQAIKDLVQSYTSNYAKLKTNARHKFKVKDRDEFTSLTKCFHIENQKSLLEVIKVNPLSNSKRRAECKLRFGNNLEKHGPILIQGKDKIIAKIVATGIKLHADAMIQWDKAMNAFYFIWVDELPVLPDPDKSFQNKRIVSLDPGSAPFQQWYSPTSGEYGELLSDAREGFKNHCLKIDKLRHRIGHRKKHPDDCVTKKGKRSYTKRKQRHKRQRTARDLRKKFRRECRRLSGKMKAAHYDAANFLLENHDIVVAPILNTGRLMERSKRGVLGSKLARALYTWSHRLFRQRLAFAAARYPGRHVYECCEPGTSKTCTNCGAWKQNLRLGDKVYNCSSCKISVDRQLAGARNNFFAAYGMARGVGWDGQSS